MIASRYVQAACQIIHDSLGTAPSVRKTVSIGGGCTGNSISLETDIGKFFVKCLPGDNELNTSKLQAEAQGLMLLSRGPIQVPKVIGVDNGVLVLQWIQAGQGSVQSAEFWQRFGRHLATLHATCISRKFGLGHDNWIGNTAQPNGQTDSWIEFCREHRIGFQLRLANQAGLLEPADLIRGQKLCERLDQILVEPEHASLLHGDLWNGNFLVDSRGNPVLIDPAVYFGHAEAEFGIITLFGGFDQRFFDAYWEILPQLDGFPERLEIYKLYHLLNHLNLFGAAYRSGCLAILRRFF